MNDLLWCLDSWFAIVSQKSKIRDTRMKMSLLQSKLTSIIITLSTSSAGQARQRFQKCEIMLKRKTYQLMWHFVTFNTSNKSFLIHNHKGISRHFCSIQKQKRCFRFAWQRKTLLCVQRKKEEEKVIFLLKWRKVFAKSGTNRNSSSTSSTFAVITVSSAAIAHFFLEKKISKDLSNQRPQQQQQQQRDEQARLGVAKRTRVKTLEMMLKKFWEGLPYFCFLQTRTIQLTLYAAAAALALAASRVYFVWILFWDGLTAEGIPQACMTSTPRTPSCQ